MVVIGARGSLRRMNSPENVRAGRPRGRANRGSSAPRRASGVVGRVRRRIGSIGIIQRWGWLIALGLAVVIAGIGIGVFVLALLRAGWPDFWFDDLEVLTAATRRLFAGESWYLPRQLDGPYPTEFGDVLYPPVAAWFFAPWLVLPSVVIRRDPGGDPDVARACPRDQRRGRGR